MPTVTLTDEEAFKVQVALDWYYEPHMEHPLAERWRTFTWAPPVPPSPPDVLWFAHSQSFYYKPVSAAGRERFDCFFESRAFPDFYGFLEHRPDKFNDFGLIFLEIPAPAPTTYPIDPDCYLPPVADVVWFKAGRGNYQFKPVSDAAQTYFRDFYKESSDYPGYYRFGSDTLIRLNPALTFAEEPAKEPAL